MDRFQSLVILFAIWVFSISGAAAADCDGGVVGGGGNVLGATPPEVPQDVSEVKVRIQQAREMLPEFIKVEIAQFEAGQLKGREFELIQKLNRRKNKTVERRLAAVRMQIRSSEACHDSFGHEVDGSIYVPQEHSFCISALGIANKVTMDQVAVQSAALILHEFSELQGFSDEEAIELQKMALQKMNGGVSPDYSAEGCSSK